MVYFSHHCNSYFTTVLYYLIIPTRFINVSTVAVLMMACLKYVEQVLGLDVCHQR